MKHKQRANCLAATYVFPLPENVFVLQRKELRQPRNGNTTRQERLNFAILTVKNGIFARFARASVIVVHFEAVLVLWATWALDDQFSPSGSPNV